MKQTIIITIMISTILLSACSNQKIVSNDGFCGIGGTAKCEKDFDCIIAGCSNQACIERHETLDTDCEYKECYDFNEYNMTCGCNNKKCAWTIS